MRPDIKTSLRNLLLGTLALSAVLPICNYVVKSDLPHDARVHRSSLFKTDFLYRHLSAMAFPLGISINPSQTIIGLEGWMYLGEDYSQIRTITKRGMTRTSRIADQAALDTMMAWDDWFRGQNVKAFHILIGPNKESVYPEFLPSWARSEHDSRTDFYVQPKARALYVDPRPELAAAKARYPHRLYYRTDTHWNTLGGWVAYQGLMQRLKADNKSLTAWSDQDLSSVTVTAVPGGDLARLILLSGRLRDERVEVQIRKQTTPPSTVTGVARGAAIPNHQGAQAPLDLQYVITPKALNSLKLLWLTDSFDKAMTPFVYASFKEVIHLGYGKAFKKSEKLQELVELVKPDYVVIAAVERNLWSKSFLHAPP